jgi:hypothetical protein
MKIVDTLRANGEIDKAIEKLIEEVQAGVEHGFFECLVTCEIVNGRKRRLIIKAGKSHQYMIPEEEIKR